MRDSLNRRTVVLGLPPVGAAPLGFAAGPSDDLPAEVEN